MDTVILNIGLNVGNSEPNKQLTNSLVEAMRIGTIIDTKVIEGIYNGFHERTLVVKVEYVSSLDAVINSVRTSAFMLSQDCIALYHEKSDLGTVIYPNGWKGEKMKFNSNYFIL